MAKRRRVHGPGLLAAARWLFTHPQPLILLAMVIGLSWSFWVYVRSAEAFRVEQVVLPPTSTLNPPDSLLGANIWSVDVRALSAALAQQQPWLKQVRVVRQLPNTLRIDPVVRVPVAYVRLNGWYAVDAEGFILPQAEVLEEGNRMVRLVGFQQAGSTLRAGRLNEDERLQLALRVLALLRRAPPAISRHVSELNVADLQQIRLILDDETEVRCGSETEFAMHLERLRSTLNVLARQAMPARYIDVRFPEPVIGPRS